MKGRELGSALVKTAKLLEAESEYNVLSNNGAGAFQSVFHLHFHLIPKRGATGVFFFLLRVNSCFEPFSTTDGLRLGLWFDADLSNICKLFSCLFLKEISQRE